MRPYHAHMQMTATLQCYSRELRTEERARHPYIGKALGSFACAKDRAMHTGDLYVCMETGLAGNRTRDLDRQIEIHLSVLSPHCSVSTRLTSKSYITEDCSNYIITITLYWSSTYRVGQCSSQYGTLVVYLAEWPARPPTQLRNKNGDRSGFFLIGRQPFSKGI